LRKNKNGYPRVRERTLEDVAMVFVSQYLVHYFLVTTLFLVLLFQLQTQSVYISTQFGKQLA